MVEGENWLPHVVLWTLPAALVYTHGSRGTYKDHPGRGSSSWIPLLSPGTIEHSPKRSPWSHLHKPQRKQAGAETSRAFCAWHTLAWFTLLSAYSVQASYFSLDGSSVFPSMFPSCSWDRSCFHPMATMSTRIRGVHEYIRVWANTLTWLEVYDYGNMVRTIEKST